MAAETSDGHFDIAFASDDGEVGAVVSVRRASSVTVGSVFRSVEEASRFFSDAPEGYAVTPSAGVLDGVRLMTEGWSFEPLAVDEARSTFYDDARRFPAGSIALDSAFLMTGLPSRWEALPDLALPEPASRLVP